MAKAQDRIALQTYKTDLSSIAELLYLVKSKQPVSTSSDEAMFIAYAASKGTQLKEDTHSRKTLFSWGLIQYDITKTSYNVSPLGEKLLLTYDSATGKIRTSELVQIALLVLAEWHFVDAGRDIHPGMILLKLLSDNDVGGTITEHEFTNFLVSPTSLKDEDYPAIKAELLAFRARGAAAISEDVEQSKSWLFFPALEARWGILKSVRSFELHRFPNGQYRWLMETTNAPKISSVGVLPKKNWSPRVTEYQLTPEARAILETFTRCHTKKEQKMQNLPHQMIVYGAPGTGKSFGLNTDTADDENVFRVTFHPDSDYASFVGAYKPTMDAVPRVAMNGTQVKLPTFDPAIGADDLAKIKSEKRVAYEFVPQAFMNAYVAAWTHYSKAAAGTAPKDVYLIIEEINRGNCAQVFGDIFQLLDRGDAGWSTYPILADRDLGTWLNEKHFGTPAFAQLGNKSAPDKIKASDWDEVRKGKMLLIPPNLYIWATMNTSDQSLFPIDSAFKRRWDWKYVPISKPDKDDDANWIDRAIEVEPHKKDAEGNLTAETEKKYFDWWNFVRIVNEAVGESAAGEDKKLGYFFVKAPDTTGIVTSDQLVNKVLFYLLKDVFKDDDLPVMFCRAGNKKPYSFEDFFYDESKDGHKAGDINPDVVAEFLAAMKSKNGEIKLEAVSEAPKSNGVKKGQQAAT